MKLTRTDEPTNPDFDALVRKPGEAFLLTNPSPKYNEWKHHDFWRRIAPTLRHNYNGICAYSCYFIHEVTGDDTIEHFRPKTPNPTLAYEWTNYRYVCGKLNTWKRTDENVIDPFEIEDGWFFIEFPSLLVKPFPGLDPGLTSRIKNTVLQLKLNDYDPCIRCRQRIIEDFCSGDVNFNFLKRQAPFVGLEIERQGLLDTIWDVMSLKHMKK